MNNRIKIDLSPAHREQLQAEAERLGVSPEELARAAVADLVAVPADDFERVARKVLERNRELYKRLA